MTYGCHNRRPFVETTRVPVLRTIGNPMSKACQYSKTTIDARCDGCKWRA